MATHVPWAEATSSATSARNAAHAEFDRAHHIFVLYDDRPDGHSAVLQVRHAGTIETVYNVRGRTDADTPPKPIVLRGMTPDSSCPAEGGNSLLKTTFKALRWGSLCPWRIGAITAAAPVLLHTEYDRTT